MDISRGDCRNISEVNVVRRLRFGIVFLSVGLLLAAAFEHWSLPVSYRVWLFVPFFLAANAFFQAVFKTCGFSAFRGRRHTPEGQEVVADREERARSLHVGKKQILLSVLGAALLTALFVALG